MGGGGGSGDCSIGRKDFPAPFFNPPSTSHKSPVRAVLLFVCSLYLRERQRQCQPKSRIGPDSIFAYLLEPNTNININININIKQHLVEALLALCVLTTPQQTSFSLIEVNTPWGRLLPPFLFLLLFYFHLSS